MELKKKSIADTFNAKLKTPWVWLVIIFTIGLTILFYFSQKPQIVIYSQYIKSLTEYQILETSLMRSMERVRSGYGVDSFLVHSQSMTLREMTVSFSREMDELNIMGIKTPSANSINHFERQILSKVAGIRRYTSERILWMDRWNAVSEKMHNFPLEQTFLINEILDSARAGFVVKRPDELVLPDSLKIEVDALLNDNNELALAWSKFDNDNAMMLSANLIQFFQVKTMDEMSLKSRIPMIFYFLSILLLLSTFFFLFRSKD